MVFQVSRLVFHGFMGFYDFSCLQVGFSRFQVVFYGFRWVLRLFMALGWFFMVPGLSLWFKVGFYGYLWLWVVFSWFQAGFYGSRLIFHDSRWVFMIPDGLIWPLIVPGWFFMIPGGFYRYLGFQVVFL